MKFSLYILGLVLLGSNVFADQVKVKAEGNAAANVGGFSAQLCAMGKTEYCRITGTPLPANTVGLSKTEVKPLAAQTEAKEALETLGNNAAAEKLAEEENELEEENQEEISGAGARRRSRRNRGVRRNRRPRRNRRTRRTRKTRRNRRPRGNRRPRRNRRSHRNRRTRRGRRNRRNHRG